MSLKIDRLQLEIIIDNDQSRKQLRALESEMKQLKKEMKKVPEGSAEWNKMSDRLKALQMQHDKVIDTIGLHGLSIKELTQRQRELNLMMRNMDPRTAEYKKLAQQNKEVAARMRELRTGASQAKFSIGKLADGFNKYFAMATAAAAAITGIVFSVKNLIQGSAELSDKFADVRKTTGLTATGVRELNKDLKAIDTRSSRSELLSLARIAGKLGVTGKEDILGFVRAADQINVALAEDLGGDAEEAIRQVGKLVDVFKIKDQVGLENGLLKVGSAINALGAASTANEAYLIEFSKRMGGVATQANISVQDILGLGATLDQLGQTTEVSSTSLSKVMVDMFKDSAEYAKIAGMSVEDFTQLLNTNANEAFIKLLDGLNGNNDGLAVMAKRLDDLGVDGSRSIGVLATLSKNTAILRGQQKLSNDEFAKGTSLTDEFNVKNDTLAGTLAKIQKKLAGMFINSKFLEGINNLVTGFAKLIGATKEYQDIKIGKSFTEEVSDLNSLFEATKRTTQGTDARKIAIKQINEKYGEYLSNLLTEKSTLEDIRDAQKEANDNLIKNIAIKSKEADLSTIMNESLAAQKKQYDEMIDYFSERTGNSQLAGIFKAEVMSVIDSFVNANDLFDGESQQLLNSITKKYGVSFTEVFKSVQNIAQAQLTEQDQIKSTTEFYDAYIEKLNEVINLNNENSPGGEDGNKDTVPRNKYGQTFEEWKQQQDLFVDQEQAYWEGLDRNVLIPDEESVDDESEYLISKYKETLDGRQAFLEAFHDAGLISEAQYNDDLLKLNKERASKEIDIERLKQQGKTALMQASFDLALSLAKQGSNSYKIIASLEAAINTYAAATAALAPPPVGAGPVFGIPLAAATVITGLANVAKINAIQFATGKYDVIGATDGRTYSANYTPKATTGIYSNPTLIGGLGLVAERTPELVVDGPTLSNIQMNAPGIIEAILAMRVPQFATGNYQTPQPIAGVANQDISKQQDFTPVMIQLLTQIIEKLDKPTRAIVVYQDIQDVDDEINAIKYSVSK